MENENKKIIKIQSVGNLILSITSYAIIVLMFLDALINPQNNINFIYNSLTFIFVAEFLGIHSSFMMGTSKKTPIISIIIISIYMFMTIIFSTVLNTFYPAIILALSIIAKSSNKKYINRNISGLNLILYISSVLIGILFSPITKSLIIFSDNVLALKPEGISRCLYR